MNIGPLDGGLYADGGKPYVYRESELPDWQRRGLRGEFPFKFNWRHFAFFWSIAASVVEAFMIVYGRTPR